MAGAGAMIASGGHAAPPSSRLAALVAASNPHRILGAAVIARDPRGRVRLAEAVGTAISGAGDQQRERSLTLDDPVRVASVSKLVTTSAFMALVQAGRARLDEDVSEGLGFQLRHPAHPEVRITPAMLASHTSGLRDSPNYPLPLGSRLADAFSPGAPHFEDGAWFAPSEQAPGRWFAYANVNFAVLAQLMERRTGERFDRLMNRLVFRPHGLDCGYNWSGVTQAKRDRASALCRRDDALWSPTVDAEPPRAPEVAVFAPANREMSADDYRLGENGWVFAPQGGLRASVRDLDRLAQTFSGRGGRGLLSKASLSCMERRQWSFDPARPNGDPYGGAMRAYGLATQVLTGREGPDGDALFGRGSRDWRGHLGQAYGLLSGLWWNRRDGRTLAFAVNGTPTKLIPGRRSAFTLWEEQIVDAAGHGPFRATHES